MNAVKCGAREKCVTRGKYPKSECATVIVPHMPPAVDTSWATPYTPLIHACGESQRREIITEVVTIRPIAGPILCNPTAMFTSVREHRGESALFYTKRTNSKPHWGTP